MDKVSKNGGIIVKEEKTEALLERLNKLKDENDLKGYIESCSLERSKGQLSDYIVNVCKLKGLKKSDIIRSSDIHRTYGYQILSGEKTPSRDKLLQICIGCGFSLDETERALKIGSMGSLYPKDPRDSIIIYSLRKEYNLLEANTILYDCGFSPLGEI